MSGRQPSPVGRSKRFVVAISIAGALLGMASCSPGSLRSLVQTPVPSSEVPTRSERAKLLAEQTQPQQQVPFNPVDFDKFVGYYQSENFTAFYARVFRAGDHYYLQLTGQPLVRFFAESPTEFFATVVAAQISFVRGSEGGVTEMVVHQNGFLRHWRRISKSTYDRTAVELQQRIKANKPGPGTEASLRRFITSWEETGQPNYDDMEPAIAEAAREQAPRTAHIVRQLGAFESLKFVRVNPAGWDIYLATFANGQASFLIAPLDASGKVVARNWRVVP